MPYTRVGGLKVSDHHVRSPLLNINNACQVCHNIKATAARGATDAELAPARQAHRRAQFFLDFVEAENSMGFHAPQEAMRLLGLSLDQTRRGQAALRR
jgi:nitrite reductase (cytochrome c-552)